ncbi:MAG: hypothetical protein RI953_1278 [Pseudomonadota bacterium]|jgi:hypothetical protein
MGCPSVPFEKVLLQTSSLVSGNPSLGGGRSGELESFVRIFCQKYCKFFQTTSVAKRYFICLSVESGPVRGRMILMPSIDLIGVI